MYLSKIQVKNLFVKNFSKYAISALRRGRVCYFNSEGYEFEELENGFVRVSFFASNDRNAERRKQITETKLEQAHNLLMANGFETNGQGYRKQR
jgi:hypothetical protein